MERVITTGYLPPGIEQKTRKITFMPENIFLAQIYTPQHFHSFKGKQKNSYVQFF